MTNFVQQLKRYLFPLLGISLIAIFFEIISSLPKAIVFGISLILGLVMFKVQRPLLKYICLGVIIFLWIVLSFWVQSIWFLIGMFVIMLVGFHRESGNEFFSFGESWVHPFSQGQQYHGVQLIRPQSNQRTRLKRQSFFEISRGIDHRYEWDDINMVYLGGHSIIDLGNTLLPNQECVVMIRKLFGRTRIIVPKDIGLSLNMSALSGELILLSEHYHLVGENFRFESEDYRNTARRIKLVVSVAFGEVEVIVL